jgi:hypothetical protein
MEHDGSQLKLVCLGQWIVRQSKPELLDSQLLFAGLARAIAIDSSYRCDPPFGDVRGQILKGPRPTDLPIEQPTNLSVYKPIIKTAKALGLAVTPSPLAVLTR